MAQLDDALLEDQVVVVSGGTQGLGAAIATAAARNGARVVVTGRRRDVGEKFVAGLTETGAPRRLRGVRRIEGRPMPGRGRPRPSSCTAGSTAWSTARA